MANNRDELPRSVQILIAAIIVGAIIWALVPKPILGVVLGVAIAIIAVLSYFAYKKEGTAPFKRFARTIFDSIFRPSKPSQPTTPTAPTQRARLPDLMGDERAVFIHAIGDRCENPTCRKTGLLEIHHIRPKEQGGSNSVWNLIVLCPDDHRSAQRGIPDRQRLQQWLQDHRNQRLNLLRSRQWKYR